MPELPEVETVRRGLERLRRRPHGSNGVEVGRERTVRRTSREALIDGLTGTDDRWRPTGAASTCCCRSTAGTR